MTEFRNNSPSVSVILPNYNYGHYFVSRLKEILAQTYQVSEVIVLDDASTDKSASIIKKELKNQEKLHPTLKFVLSQNSANSGNVFSQWQKGVELATPEYIWIAELDDSCEPTFLETVMKPIIKHKKVVLSYTNSKLIGDVTRRDLWRQKLDFFRRHHLPGKYVISGKRELNKNLAIFNSIPNVSAVVFKNIPELKRILDGAKKYSLCGDWYFYSKLAEQGKIAYNPKKLNSHRLSSESVTSQTDLEKRFKEIKRVHSEIDLANKLSALALMRMEKSERKLDKVWKIAKIRQYDENMVK